MIYALFNPKANSGQGEQTKQEALPLIKQKFGGEVEERNVLELDVDKFLKELKKDDKVVIFGGDGTLYHFANNVYGKKLPCSFYLYKAGTGNDFLRDVENEVQDNLLELNKYVENLPLVKVNDIEARYVNGIGYGIDGMACEVADKKIAAGAEKVNYAGISIGLVFHGYRPRTAKITVDGVTTEFKKVWIASAMNGRYYGGGMKACPDQDRLSDHLSVLVWHGTGKLKTLLLFPKIFKGEHVKDTKHVTILTGKEIHIEYDEPCALQIDGETVLNVKSFSASKK